MPADQSRPSSGDVNPRETTSEDRAAADTDADTEHAWDVEYRLRALSSAYGDASLRLGNQRPDGC